MYLHTIYLELATCFVSQTSATIELSTRRPIVRTAVVEGATVTFEEREGDTIVYRAVQTYSSPETARCAAFSFLTEYSDFLPFEFDEVDNTAGC
jgi:hypothetical protein